MLYHGIGFPSLSRPIFYCIHMPHFLYPFISHLTLGLLPRLSYYEWCCFQHGCTNISLRLLSMLLNTYPEVDLLDHMIILFLIFWRTTIRQLYRFTFPSTVHIYILANTCYFLGFFNSTHPRQCEEVYHCGFYFHFPVSDDCQHSINEGYSPVKEMELTFRREKNHAKRDNRWNTLR